MNRPKPKATPTPTTIPPPRIVPRPARARPPLAGPPPAAASLKSPTQPFHKLAHTQTDKVVFIKEETLALSFARIGVNDGGMRRDYIKAINYVNACHAFINQIIEKNALDRANMLVLPSVTNFVPIFSHLLARRPAKRRTSTGSPATRVTAEDKRGSNPVPIRVIKPCERGRKVKEEQQVFEAMPEEGDEVALVNDDEVSSIRNTVQKQLDQFLAKIHDEFQTKQPKQGRGEEPRGRQHYEAEAKDSIELKPLPATPPSPTSAAYRYGDVAACRRPAARPRPVSPPTLRHYLNMTPPSATSDSSDIASDTDVEIN